ncbi:MAG: D-alanine--D-alanine ligase [Gammaproteobacteria bacterium]|nr:D-alanine--D-alanine ligase [Gammaproteobacteria bacterium]
MSGTLRHEVAGAAEFGRVALLLGGDSAEREISVMTGEAVLGALRSRGVDVHPVDACGAELVEALRGGGYDRVFNALHGPGGEDGVVAGLLDILGLPYTGSRQSALALSMDKHVSKLAFVHAGLRTPGWRMVRDLPEAERSANGLGFPVGMKPNRQGSSIGISRVEEPSGVAAAFRLAARYDENVMVESWIEGAEYTASMLQGEMLPVIRILPPEGQFYDFHTKYESEETRYLCPSGLDRDQEAEVNRVAELAIGELNVSGWARVDLMRDRTRAYSVLEVNTVPGMTSHSLVPMAAARADISFDELCWRILETSFDRGSGAGGH